MKFVASIVKDLKLLFRSKESAYTVVFGPILIILLVSFAFMGGEDYTMRVGAFAPVSTGYSERAIDGLNQKEYSVSVYQDKESCVASVTDGANHACLVFSDQEAGNGTIPITMLMDMSRPNIIYRISEDLSAALDVQSDALREQLAGDALLRMHQAAQAVEQGRNKTQEINERLLTIEQDLRTAQVALSQLANLTVDTSIHTTMRGYQLGLAQNTRTVVNMSLDALFDAQRLMSRMEKDCDNCSNDYSEEVSEISKDIEDTARTMQLIVDDTMQVQLIEANSLLERAITDLHNLKIKIEEDEAARQTIRNSIMTSAAAAERNRQDIAQVASGLQFAQSILEGQTVNASAMSTPVQATLVNVATSDDQLSVTYPYLLILVIMFIGMLLASILVVTDKTSRARFRNFTTPTSGNYHVGVSFGTAALLLLAEVVVILILSKLFIAQPLHLFSLSTITIMLLAVVVFTFLGMVIGHLCPTQEAAMITSISVGSVLLFVSNLIIPIEGMAHAVQALTKFNPYVVLSELLKKSMFYGVTLGQVSRQILLLLVICAVLLGLTLFIQGRNRRKYFKQDEGLLAPHTAAPLVLGGRHINDEVELLDALDHMSRAEFDSCVRSDDNAIAAWVQKELRNVSLARKLRTTSKERMILRLDKYLEKHGKNLRR